MTPALEARAREAREHAYAPYSGYAVGAALETADGRVFTGVNVENAAYPVTCCAEQVAVHSMVAAGARGVRRIAIAASGPTPYPCGACRQVLSEFADGDLEIVVVGDGGARLEYTLAELLPRPFLASGEDRPA